MPKSADPFGVTGVCYFVDRIFLCLPPSNSIPESPENSARGVWCTHTRTAEKREAVSCLNSTRELLRRPMGWLWLVSTVHLYCLGHLSS